MTDSAISDELQDRVEQYRKLIPESVFTEQTFIDLLNMPKGTFLFMHNMYDDTIRRWADGLGDLNPRFRDKDYAAKTKYGRLVAPPLILVSVCGDVLYQAITPRRARGFHSSSNWEFFQPVLEGDVIDFEGQGFSDIKVVESKFSGHMVVCTGKVDYTNQRGELVGRVLSTSHESVSLEVAKKIGKNKDTGPYRYSEEEVAAIKADREKEERRGDVPRYWEDVSEGDSVGQIVLGPWTAMDSIAFYNAGGHAGPGGKGERLAAEWARSTTRITRQYDDRLNLEVPAMLSHLENHQAQAVGLPGAYDIGMERQCHISILFTNWMGDDAFLWKYSCQYRQFVIYGDTTRVTGAVTRKYVEDGKYCVDIDYKGVNQRGAINSAGSATIILPSREYGPVRYPTPAEA